MKKSLYIALFFTFLVTFVIVLIQRFSSPSSQSTTSFQPLDSASGDQIHELAIQSLQKRSYATSLHVERIVRETSTHTSRVVSYQSEGSTLYALLLTPQGTVPKGGWPVVVVNHGYIPPEVYSTEHSYINTSTYFTKAGFVVVKPDYRGHGLSEGEAGTLRARIGYAIDVLNLLQGLNGFESINSERVFLYGHSMGGDVTLRVIEVCPTCVRGATLWAPAVTTWPESALYFSRKNDSTRLKRLEQQLQEYFTYEDYEQVSTFSNLNLIQTPLLLHHGTADESVPYDWGAALHTALQEAGKSVVFYTYQNDTHDIPRNWGVALGRDVEFFRSLLD